MSAPEANEDTERTIEWTESALEDMAALEKGHRPSRATQYRQIRRDRRAGDVKRLQKIDPPEFRLRVGDWRVRFHQDRKIIRILRVLHRKEAYR